MQPPRSNVATLPVVYTSLWFLKPQKHSKNAENAQVVPSTKMSAETCRTTPR